MRIRTKTNPPVHESIVTLIDVVFFLLVFFMLIGRMDATAPFDLVPPFSHSGETLPAGGATISVSFDGRMSIDGVEADEAAVKTKLRARIATGQPPLLVRINADGQTPLRHVLPLVAWLEDSAAIELVLVVTPEPQ